jgi:anti-sigma B factor antagonist
MTQLTIDVRETGQRRVVVAVAGDVDIATAPLVARALLWHTDCDVIVDLSAVGFLDSSGLTALVQAYKRLQQTGHTLRTTGEREGALAVMKIAGLLDVFHGGLAVGPAAT